MIFTIGATLSCTAAMIYVVSDSINMYVCRVIANGAMILGWLGLFLMLLSVLLKLARHLP